jgi:hypothetical protein
VISPQQRPVWFPPLHQAISSLYTDAFSDARHQQQQPEQSGIISAAIANAQTHPPQTGDENVSLLQQHAAKQDPKKTQFTFTCGSNSANKMAWPEQTSGYPHSTDTGKENTWPPSPNNQATLRGGGVGSSVPLPASTQRALTTHATQTSPNMGQRMSHGSSAPVNMQQPPPPNAANTPVPAPPRKPRRRPSKEYAIAARQRRLQQDLSNWHNRPPREEIWICEFCEYESIFGHPPEALVRQYEIRDRKERKRIAEKRRLLEKARMKGRKGKKGNKNQKNANNNAMSNNVGNAHHASGHGTAPQAVPGHQPRYDPTLDDRDQIDPVDDEDYEDDYEGSNDADDGLDDEQDILDQADIPDPRMDHPPPLSRTRGYAPQEQHSLDPMATLGQPPTSPYYSNSEKEKDGLVKIDGTSPINAARPAMYNNGIAVNHASTGMKKGTNRKNGA